MIREAPRRVERRRVVEGKSNDAGHGCSGVDDRRANSAGRQVDKEHRGDEDGLILRQHREARTQSTGSPPELTPSVRPTAGPHCDEGSESERGGGEVPEHGRGKRKRERPEAECGRGGGAGTFLDSLGDPSDEEDGCEKAESSRENTEQPDIAPVLPDACELVLSAQDPRRAEQHVPRDGEERHAGSLVGVVVAVI